MKLSDGKKQIIEWACWLFLAVIFLVGGLPKLFDVDSFAKVIEAYGILPDMFIYPAAIILPLFEVATGVALILRKKWALISSLLLMIIFIAVLSYGLILGLDIDCGCFAVGDPEHTAFSGLREALIRDLFILIPLLYLLASLIFERKPVLRKR